MSRHASSQPTDVELQILNILWELGPSTVREIHNRMMEAKETVYSTTVKMLLVMLEKGLVKRDDSVRPQIYRSARSQQKTQKGILDDLIHKVYDGSAKSLVMQALSAGPASKEDLAEIRNLLDELS
ncbi:MAG: BlaI family penicillinase repressor [Pirellulaceae bacterium]|jgi:BlaI family penicillinase repressor